MNKLPCPHCKKETISWWDKYKAAKWALIYCPDCGGRICSNPYILPFYTLLYVWDVLFFGLVAYIERNLWYVLILVVIWLILDWFSLYFPLSALKPKHSTATTSQDVKSNDTAGQSEVNIHQNSVQRKEST